MKAFEHGWKLTRITNSAKLLTGSGCNGLQYLTDTLTKDSRYGFEFQR